MAIKKSFGGSTLRKPGAYSISKTSPDAGSPVISSDTILLVGESDAGPGGSEEGIQFYSASALSRLIAKYRSGPIVDAAKVCLAPSLTPGVGGAGRIGVYKTNASVAASLDLDTSFGALEALEYGVGGNRLTEKVELSSEVAPFVLGSAPITDFAGLDGLTLEIRKNGSALETVTFSSPTDIDDVISQVNAQTTDLTASEDSPADTLKIEADARTNGHRDGYGQSIEVVGGTALSKLFLTAGQFGIPTTEQQASFTTSQPRDSRSEIGTVGGTIALKIGRDDSDSCTAATVTVDGTDITLTATGSTSYTLSKTDYPLLKNLKEAISGLAGWIIEMSATLNNEPTSSLDQVSAIGAFSEAGNKPARIKRDLYAVEQFFDDSILVSLTSTETAGLPDALGTTNFSGGLRGASASSNFDAGFTAALAEEVNVIIPLISQDASEDIVMGETAATSTYDIETVQVALDSHLRLRGSIKNRKEAQGMVGYRKAAKADVFEQSANLGSELIQMCMDDVLVIDSSNELKWKQPHIFATMLAGMRTGTEVGEPLTHKFAAVQGAGHYVNPSTGISEGDYDALVDYDDAIDAGITSLEPAAGGFRVMVDNTTYGADANFVFNRGSVVEAAQYVAKTIRADAELSFVGVKTAIASAESIKSRISTKLEELFNARILTASDDAPKGFREDTFIVEVTGNTAEVQVEIKPVQGLDFILVTFTLGESRQSA